VHHVFNVEDMFTDLFCIVASIYISNAVICS